MIFFANNLLILVFYISPIYDQPGMVRSVLMLCLVDPVRCGALQYWCGKDCHPTWIEIAAACRWIISCKHEIALILLLMRSNSSPIVRWRPVICSVQCLLCTASAKLWNLSCFACSALFKAVLCFASHLAECSSRSAEWSRLSGVPIGNRWLIMDDAVIMDVGGPVEYATIINLGRFIAFVKK